MLAKDVVEKMKKLLPLVPIGPNYDELREHFDMQVNIYTNKARAAASAVASASAADNLPAVAPDASPEWLNVGVRVTAPYRYSSGWFRPFGTVSAYAAGQASCTVRFDDNMTRSIPVANVERAPTDAFAVGDNVVALFGGMKVALLPAGLEGWYPGEITDVGADTYGNSVYGILYEAGAPGEKRDVQKRVYGQNIKRRQPATTSSNPSVEL